MLMLAEIVAATVQLQLLALQIKFAIPIVHARALPEIAMVAFRTSIALATAPILLALLQRSKIQQPAVALVLTHIVDAEPSNLPILLVIALALLAVLALAKTMCLDPPANAFVLLLMHLVVPVMGISGQRILERASVDALAALLLLTVAPLRAQTFDSTSQIAGAFALPILAPMDRHSLLTTVLAVIVLRTAPIAKIM